MSLSVAIIACGTSVKATWIASHARQYDIVVAVNHAILLCLGAVADWWVAGDLWQTWVQCPVAAERSNEAMARAFVRKGVVWDADTPVPDRVRFSERIPHVELWRTIRTRLPFKNMYSGVSSILLTARLNPSRVDLYGFDMSTEDHFYGVIPEPDNEQRWSRERLAFQVAIGDLMARGAVVRNMTTEGPVVMERKTKKSSTVSTVAVVGIGQSVLKEWTPALSADYDAVVAVGRAIQLISRQEPDWWIMGDQPSIQSAEIKQCRPVAGIVCDQGKESLVPQVPTIITHQRLWREAALALPFPNMYESTSALLLVPRLGAKVAHLFGYAMSGRHFIPSVSATFKTNRRDKEKMAFEAAVEAMRAKGVQVSLNSGASFLA